MARSGRTFRDIRRCQADREVLWGQEDQEDRRGPSFLPDLDHQEDLDHPFHQEVHPVLSRRFFRFCHPFRAYQLGLSRLAVLCLPGHHRCHLCQEDQEVQGDRAGLEYL